jgi:PAS domain S-box-containing protein
VTGRVSPGRIPCLQAWIFEKRKHGWLEAGFQVTLRPSRWLSGKRLTPLHVVITYACAASLWIFLSGHLLAISVSDPALAHLLENVKGFLFVAVSSALLYLLLRTWDWQTRSRSRGEASIALRLKSRRAVVAVFAALTLLVPLLGILVARVHGPELERAAYGDLQVVTALKTEQIQKWIAERRGEGRALMDSDGFVQRVIGAVQKGDQRNLQLIEVHLKGVQQAYGYSTLFLLDVQGRVITRSGQPGILPGQVGSLLNAAFAAQDIQMSEMWTAPDGRRYLDFVVPLLSRSATGTDMVGAVVLQLSPDTMLFPMVQQWPRSVRSGEILLVRGEGSRVLFLNASALQSASAPIGEPQVSDVHLPAAVAIRSEQDGAMRGLSSRGVDVLAAYGPIQGTSWRLVAEMERAEVLAPLYVLVFWICLISSCAISVCGLALLMLWNKHQQLMGAEIQRSTQRMSQYFYDMPFVGMTMTSPQSGGFVGANTRFCEILGFTLDELLEKNWKSITYPEDVSTELPEYDNLLSGALDGYRIEKRYVRKNGTIVFVSQDTKCVRADDGSIEFIAATVQDITEQRAMQQKLLDSEENYRTLADSGQALIWRAGVDKLCYYFNRAWLEFTGRALTQELGNGWVEGVHPEDLDRCLDTYIAAFDRREPFSMDYRLRRYDGQYRWIQDDGCPCHDASGTFTGYIGNCLDITERYLTRQVLAESEAKLRAVVSNLPVVLSTVSADGVFTMSEGKALEQIGYRPGQLVGTSVQEFYHDKPAMLAAFAQAAGGECAHAQQHYGDVWFESFLEPFIDAQNERGVMITCINTTERKQAEDSLRMNVDRMECLARVADYQASSTQDMLDYALHQVLAINGSEFGYIYRYDEDTQEFTLNSWSRGAMEACSVMTPQTRYALQNTGFWGEVVRQRKPLINNDFQAEDALKKGIPKGHVSIRRFMSIPVFSGERIVAVVGLANRDEDYKEKDVEQIKMLMASVWNLVEQRSDREALQLASDQLKVSQALAQVGGWEIDVVNNNARWTEETYRIHELIPDTFTPTLETALDFYTQESRAILSAAVERAINAGLGFDLELSLVTAKGRTRQVHTACQVYKENDKVVRIIGAFQDITAYKRIERELREHQEHLEDLVLLRTRELVEARDAAERATKAKSAFLANMSHEIRTPINAVLGMSHLALRTPLTPKQREYLDKIMISANMLLGVINDILDFSKIEAGRLELSSVEFLLGDVLDKVIAVTGLKAADRHVEFLVRVEPHTPEVLIGDPARLGQVLTNLCSNAVKFTNAGEVMLSVVRAEGAQGGKVNLLFSVRDTGIGMSAEQVAQLFTPFFQGDASDTRRFGGTGLGLAICKQLVEMMGGHIWVASEPGRGSEFSFSVPMGLGTSGTRHEFRISSDLRGMHAMIADQSVAGREVLTELLQGFGWRVTSRPSAAEALDEMRRDEKLQPDFLLVDWKQPEDSVAELVGLGRIRSVRCKLILMIVGGESAETRFLESVGPDAEVFKPLTASSLFDAVMTAFGRGSAGLEPRLVRSPPPVSTEGLAGGRVLLVEDNAFNQQVARELLESVGMTVVVAQNGREAIDFVQTSRFDVVLMDVQMPVMDGLEATRRMRMLPALNGLPILAMTAHAMLDEQNHCMEAGMDDFLSKPIEPPVLFSKLAQWLRGARPLYRSRLAIPVVSKEPLLSTLPKSLPGISIAAGLHYCNDKEEFYLRMLREFMASKHGEGIALRQKIMEEAGEHAVRMAHSMKSVAGAIGAMQLSQVSAQLEHALRDGQKDVLPVLLERFEAALGEVTDGLRVAFDAAPKMAGGRPPVEVNPVVVIEIARKMLVAVNADVGEALELLTEMRRIVPEGKAGDLVSQLERALNVFDIDRTVSLLGELIGTMSGRQEVL